MGGYYGELNVKLLKKRLSSERESVNISTPPSKNPQQFYMVSCITFGLMAGEMETPKVSNQSRERNEEKRHQLRKVDNLRGRK